FHGDRGTRRANGRAPNSEGWASTGGSAGRAPNGRRPAPARAGRRWSPGPLVRNRACGTDPPTASVAPNRCESMRWLRRIPGTGSPADGDVDARRGWSRRQSCSESTRRTISSRKAGDQVPRDPRQECKKQEIVMLAVKMFAARRLAAVSRECRNVFHRPERRSLVARSGSPGGSRIGKCVVLLALLTAMTTPIARAGLDDTNWSRSFGVRGVDSHILDMIEWNGDIVAAGLFECAGSSVVYGVALWDGADWRPLG